MIATITILSFLKCLGYVLLGIGAVAVFVAVCAIWAEWVWPKVRPYVPRIILEWFPVVLAIAILIIGFLGVFVLLPWTICTESGGCS